MTIKYIDEMEIAEKRLFIRCDFNVPLDDAGEITDDTRIRAAIPTINYALGKEAKLILASHLGRPKGEPNPKFSLKPVAMRLAEILNRDIIFPEDCIGDGVKKLASELKSGGVMLLENLRFHKEETDNDANFAEKLAALCDIYVNDAFGTAHRAHASTEGITHYVKEKCAGFLMKREIESLDMIVKNPKRPFISIIGGAKVSDKLGVIENLLGISDKLIIGGAMAYTFLKAKGFQIGGSLYEPDKVHAAKKILDRAATRGVEILLPVDNVVANECREGVNVLNTEDANIPDNMLGLDIGKKTVQKYTEAVSKAATIFWNGPMGVCETKPFQEGTFALARAIAETSAVSVVGGGDSVAAVNKTGVAEKFSHICTGGGASLEFIEGKKLPGITALEE